MTSAHEADQTFEVIVVGGGSTGAAALYHLAHSGLASHMLLLEAGTIGLGSDAEFVIDTAQTPPDVGTASEDRFVPSASGTAVFPGGELGPSTIKMVVTVPPYKSVAEFADHHGWDGVATYLAGAAFGRDLEIALARQLLPAPGRQVKQLGSVMVCEAGDVEALRTEYDRFVQLGCECTWLDCAAVTALHGSAAGFAAGIRFPHDAIIDSTGYARALIEAVMRSGKAAVRERCPPVIAVHAGTPFARVLLADGSVLRAQHVVMATGGSYLDDNLAGILTPCFSYLVALPAAGLPDTANYFTLGFSHDWAVCDGFMRISGEDHYSGLKRPRAELRCSRLAEWGWAKYPAIARPSDGSAPPPTRYGIYSETPDHMPLVGTPYDGCNVAYLVGCNAWGQASLSAAAALTPALLGLRDFTPRERRLAELFSIRRFVGKAAKRSHL